MTINRGLFIRQTGTTPNIVGTTPVEARLAMAGLIAENAPGVPRQGLLAQADPVAVKGSTTMAYTVPAINPVISNGINDGVYLPTLTGTTTVPTTAAPAAGSRWDLIWIKQNDPEKTDPNNLAIFGVTQGAANSSPSKPTGTVPVGAYVIAEALVGPLITKTTDASITQLWRHTAARGAPIPVRSTAERAEITTPALGATVIRLDVKGTPVETWDPDSAKWGRIGGHAVFTSKSNPPSGTAWGAGNLTAHPSEYSSDPAVAAPSGSDFLAVPSAGTYAVSVAIVMKAGQSVSGFSKVYLVDNAGVEVAAGFGATGGNTLSVSLPGIALLKGGRIGVKAYHQNGVQQEWTFTTRITRIG